MSDVTQILAAVRGGDADAVERLFELVYAELRQVAAQKMARESAGQTLQPTALVHEAWLRLGADAQPHWQNRAHFFAAAAEAMRRILVDRARRKRALRHGAGAEHVELDDLNLPAPVEDDQLLALDDALDTVSAAAAGIGASMNRIESALRANADHTLALDAAQDHYLVTRMARNTAAYLDGARPFGDTLYVEPMLMQALHGLVRDIGREVPDLRFRAVQRCVTDDRRPLERTLRIVPVVPAKPPTP